MIAVEDTRCRKEREREAIKRWVSTHSYYGGKMSESFFVNTQDPTPPRSPDIRNTLSKGATLSASEFSFPRL